jgi:virginiamycin B lyase
MFKRLFAILGACVCAGVMAACATRGNNPLPDGSGGDSASKHAGRVKVTMHLVIAGPPKHHRRGGRGAKFVSPSTNGIMIAVYPHGAARTAANLIASAAVNVSSGSPACAGKTGFPRTCSASVRLEPTAKNGDDFVLSTYDAVPVSGSFANAHLLGTGSLSNQPILLGKANSIAVFVGGAIATLTGNPALASLPGDGSQHTLGLVIDPEDFGNNPITAGANDPFVNPIVVSAVENGGTGHVKFSLNGGTAATTVTVAHSTDAVQVVYDGRGTVGYSAAISLNAPAVGGSSSAAESMMLSPLFVTSSDADYATPNLALKGNGDELTMNVSEYGAPSSTAYAATGVNCAAIADNDAPQGTGASASFHVYARGTISTPAPGSGCEIAVSDGTSTVNVAVSNTYVGILGKGTLAIAEFSTAVAAEAPKVITVGPDGAMWFAECLTGKVGRISVTIPNPVATDFPLPTTGGRLDPEGIAPGPDGNLWWADCGGASTVGKITTAGVGTSYSAPMDSYPTNIVQGPDGAMWFAECGSASNAIGRVTATGIISNLGTSASGPVGIVLGSDGNLWFTARNANSIGKITTDGTVLQIGVPTTNSLPYGITAGPDGALWFVEGGTNKIGRIPTSATQTSDISEYSTGITGSGLKSITTGPDGALWFTECLESSSGPLSGESIVGRIDPQSDDVTEYAVLTAGSDPYGIAAGPDGAIWFTEVNASNVGRIAIQTSASMAHTGGRAHPAPSGSFHHHRRPRP